VSTTAKPSVEFAHGAWADGSRFSKVIPVLQAEGHEVFSTQNSLDTLAGDEADSSHVPMLSKPKLVVDAIPSAAKSPDHALAVALPVE
jgi:hypothetical protein